MKAEKLFNKNNAWVSMLNRIEKFTAAMKSPHKRLGEDRKPVTSRKVEPIAIQRFEQLNKEDRWSTTEYWESPSRHGSAAAKIHVQDPQDVDDVQLPNITVEDLLDNKAP